MNVGIVGFGSIGTEVAKALIKGVENFCLFGVTTRSKSNAEKRISKLDKNIDIYDFEIEYKDMLEIYSLERNQRLVPNLEINEIKYPFD